MVTPPVMAMSKASGSSVVPIDSGVPGFQKISHHGSESALQKMLAVDLLAPGTKRGTSFARLISAPIRRVPPSLAYNRSKKSVDCRQGYGYI